MIGYLDLPSGISGDMFLGCLVDGGWPIEELRATLSRLKLPAGDWSVQARPVMKGALRATLVDVRVAEGSATAPVFAAAGAREKSAEHSHEHSHKHPHAHDHHHHDHPHSHPNDHSHAHGHTLDHLHKHPPDHPHDDAHPQADAQQHEHGHSHSHSHRNLDDVKAIIQRADLPGAVKDRAIAVFTRLAHAEAKVHGTRVESIHFHEVGALDAIVDIVGTVAGIQALNLSRLYASPLPLGHGFAEMAHGQIPLPAPATLELLAAASAPTVPAPGPGELVTPTGAALVAELAEFSQPAMRIQRIAVGAGQREMPWPNIARLWLGVADEPARASAAAATFVQIETNIDDMNPQLYSAVAERLMAAGARDVWLAPVQMKKGRPGVVLAVLADAGLEQALSDLILRETTTLGVRVIPMHRHEARRELRPVDTPFGPIQTKLKWVGEHLVGAMPEYEDCRRAAEARNLPVRSVYEAALAAARTAFAPDAEPVVAPPARG